MWVLEYLIKWSFESTCKSKIQPLATNKLWINESMAHEMNKEQILVQNFNVKCELGLRWTDWITLATEATSSTNSV